MYYILTSDDANPGAMLMHRPKLPILDKITFDNGHEVKEKIPPLEIHMSAKEQGELLDYVWTTLGGIIISARFRKLFESLDINNIQYFPIRIINKVTKEVRDNYYVANVIGRIACLDLETSQVTNMVIPGQILSIEEMHLDEKKIQDQAIFRLDEWVPIILCNEAIRKAALSAGITGCVFLPAEGYST